MADVDNWCDIKKLVFDDLLIVRHERTSNFRINSLKSQKNCLCVICRITVLCFNYFNFMNRLFLCLCTPSAEICVIFNNINIILIYYQLIPLSTSKILALPNHDLYILYFLCIYYILIVRRFYQFSIVRFTWFLWLLPHVS